MRAKTDSTLHANVNNSGRSNNGRFIYTHADFTMLSGCSFTLPQHGLSLSLFFWRGCRHKGISCALFLCRKYETDSMTSVDGNRKNNGTSFGSTNRFASDQEEMSKFVVLVYVDWKFVRCLSRAYWWNKFYQLPWVKYVKIPAMVDYCTRYLFLKPINIVSDITFLHVVKHV